MKEESPLPPRHAHPALLVAILATVAIAQDPQPVRARPACLSLSPLRSLPAAHQDSARASFWRDRLLDSLSPKLEGTGWRAAAAGGCPESLPILDIFQQSGDLTRDEDGSLMRVRLEWRHRDGTTIALLDDPEHPELQIGTWATQIKVTADLQLARVSILSDPSVRLSQDQNELGWRRVGATPLEWIQPPGAIRLRVESGKSSGKRFDSLVEAGQTLRWVLSIPPEPQRSRWTLPFWGATALCLAGGLWYSLEMERAYSRYSRLDATDSDEQFQSRWSDVENASLIRNILLGGTGTLLAAAVYVQFK